MNPKLTRKQKELALLENILNNLKNANIDPNSNLFAFKVVENSIFNIQRTIDLIKGIYD